MAHRPVYAAAEAYRIAFSWRNWAREVAFLREAFRRHGRGELRRVLDLACGPGDHLLALAAAGLEAVGLDLSPEMVALCRRRGADATEGDMRSFRLAHPVDMTTLMMDSLAYLLSPGEMLDHLASVAEAVRPGGVYVVEATHPRDHLTSRRSTCNDWTAEEAGVRVRTRWGSEGDPFDPVSQVRQVSVRVEVEDGAVHVAQAPQRAWTWGEVQLAVAASPAWELAAAYGALDMEQPFDDSQSAWRMVCVLRRG